MIGRTTSCGAPLALAVGWAVVVVVATASLAAQTGIPILDPSAPPQRIATVHLPNAVRVHPRVVSGGLPDGDAAFAELRSLGIKTVISVDGATPDVETARRNGLRYVHLPHGYDGVPKRRAQELAKAILELEGPFYLHCHHGRHRSPAAATAACVAAGLLPETVGVSVLELAGTSPAYRGLYASARGAERIDRDSLARLDVSFNEAVAPPPMVESMIAIDRSIERLKAAAAADWRSPPDRPEFDPAHEALLLREHFSELLRAECVAPKGAAFIQLLKQSESSARELEHALSKTQNGATTAVPGRTASVLFARVNADCTVCHERFRDTPLDGD